MRYVFFLLVVLVVASLVYAQEGIYEPPQPAIASNVDWDNIVDYNQVDDTAALTEAILFDKVPAERLADVDFNRFKPDELLALYTDLRLEDTHFDKLDINKVEALLRVDPDLPDEDRIKFKHIHKVLDNNAAFFGEIPESSVLFKRIDRHLRLRYDHAETARELLEDPKIFKPWLQKGYGITVLGDEGAYYPHIVGFRHEGREHLTEDLETLSLQVRKSASLSTYLQDSPSLNIKQLKEAGHTATIHEDGAMTIHYRSDGTQTDFLVRDGHIAFGRKPSVGQPLEDIPQHAMIVRRGEVTLPDTMSNVELYAFQGTTLDINPAVQIYGGNSGKQLARITKANNGEIRVTDGKARLRQDPRYFDSKTIQATGTFLVHADRDFPITHIGEGSLTFDFPQAFNNNHYAFSGRTMKLDRVNPGQPLLVSTSTKTCAESALPCVGYSDGRQRGEKFYGYGPSLAANFRGEEFDIVAEGIFDDNKQTHDEGGFRKLPLFVDFKLDEGSAGALTLKTVGEPAVVDFLGSAFSLRADKNPENFVLDVKNEFGEGHEVAWGPDGTLGRAPQAASLGEAYLRFADTPPSNLVQIGPDVFELVRTDLYYIDQDGYSGVYQRVCPAQDAGCQAVLVNPEGRIVSLDNPSSLAGDKFSDDFAARAKNGLRIGEPFQVLPPVPLKEQPKMFNPANFVVGANGRMAAGLSDGLLYRLRDLGRIQGDTLEELRIDFGTEYKPANSLVRNGQGELVGDGIEGRGYAEAYRRAIEDEGIGYVPDPNADAQTALNQFLLATTGTDSGFIRRPVNQPSETLAFGLEFDDAFGVGMPRPLVEPISDQTLQLLRTTTVTGNNDETLQAFNRRVLDEEGINYDNMNNRQRTEAAQRIIAAFVGKDPDAYADGDAGEDTKADGLAYAQSLGWVPKQAQEQSSTERRAESSVARTRYEDPEQVTWPSRTGMSDAVRNFWEENPQLPGYETRDEWKFGSHNWKNFQVKYEGRWYTIEQAVRGEFDGKVSELRYVQP